jgi:hypothetical protein
MPILNNFQGFYYSCTPKARDTTVALTSLGHSVAKLVLPNAGIKKDECIDFLFNNTFPKQVL